MKSMTGRRYPQAQLAGDFFSRFQVEPRCSFFDVAAFGRAEIDVDGRARLPVGSITVDRRTAVSRGRAVFDLAFDLEAVE
jgi:hypothetical protein